MQNLIVVRGAPRPKSVYPKVLGLNFVVAPPLGHTAKSEKRFWATHFIYNRLMTLSSRPAQLIDLPLLTKMNQDLIEDEGSSNTMNSEQLESRMKRWLNSWHIELFLWGEVVIGYIVYRLQRNEADSKDIIYIRHYFISREYRRQGLGRESFKLLKEKHFSKDAKVYLEVLWHNQRGRDFWASLGFSPYSITMKLE